MKQKAQILRRKRTDISDGLCFLLLQNNEENNHQVADD
jgi:hypothetical protein